MYILVSHALTVPINAKEIWCITIPINAKNYISGQGILSLQVYEKVSYAVQKCTLLFVKAINPTDFQRTFLAWERHEKIMDKNSDFP